MPSRFRLAIAQSNPTVGALKSNAEKARRCYRQAAGAGADMLALPELFISGYPPQDLVLKSAFTNDCMRQIHALAEQCADGPAIGIGGPLLRDGRLYNAYFILHGGSVKVEILKHHLPNHAVFDEARHFTQGAIPGPFRIGDAKIGTPICEDAWHEDICESLEESGADILVVPNGSPYARNKVGRRHSVMVSRVVETGLPLAYVNMAGGQDDLVFDGGSFVVNPGGSLALQMPQFDESLAVVDFSETPDGWRAEQGDLAPICDEWEQDYRVMIVALRDYLAKNGFGKVLLGLSGGVDSALVATLAVDALGTGNVRCVLLPSEYTSDESKADAMKVARNLGCRLDEIPIGGIQEGRSRSFGTAFPKPARKRSGGKYPVPSASSIAHGAVEQIRRSPSYYGEQIGGGGRVCNDLRRHGGRVQSHQRSLQDARISDLPMAQFQPQAMDARAERRSRSPKRHRKTAVRRIAPESKGFGQPSRIRDIGRHSRIANRRRRIRRRS